MCVLCRRAGPTTAFGRVVGRQAIDCRIQARRLGGGGGSVGSVEPPSPSKLPKLVPPT